MIKAILDLWTPARKVPLLRFLVVGAIAAAMTFVGTWGLNKGHYEDVGSGLLLSTGGYPKMSALYFIPPSLIAWVLMVPILAGRRFWWILPASIIAPFIGSAVWALGLLCAGGPIGVVWGGFVTYLAWTFILNSAVVMFPTSIITGSLIWVALNGYSSNDALGRKNEVR